PQSFELAVHFGPELLLINVFPELTLDGGKVLLHRLGPAEAAEQDELVLHRDDAGEFPSLEGEGLLLNDRRTAVLADRGDLAAVCPRRRLHRILLGELREIR